MQCGAASGRYIGLEVQRSKQFNRARLLIASTLLCNSAHEYTHQARTRVPRSACEEGESNGGISNPQKETPQHPSSVVGSRVHRQHREPPSLDPGPCSHIPTPSRSPPESKEASTTRRHMGGPRVTRVPGSHSGTSLTAGEPGELWEEQGSLHGVVTSTPYAPRPAPPPSVAKAAMRKVPRIILSRSAQASTTPAVTSTASGTRRCLR